MTQGVAREHSKNTQAQIARTFERQLNIARPHVSNGEMGEIMVEAAVMMARTAAASIAGMAGDTPTAVKLFQETLKAIIASIENGTEEALARAIDGLGLEL